MVDVPTKEEFVTLQQRVANLENDFVYYEDTLKDLDTRVTALEGSDGGSSPPPAVSLVEHIQQSVVELFAGNPEWADAFNQTSVDSTKWNIINTNYGTTNGERQCYDTAQSTVGGDLLKLTASGTDKTYGGKTYPFRSGMVTSRQLEGGLKYKRAYGYWEVEAKAPHGDAYWPAFWLVGPSDGSTPGWPDYGEFDIVEWNGVRPDVFFQTFHYKGKDGGNKHTSKTTQNLLSWDSESTGTKLTSSNVSYQGPTTDWHRYGFWWEPGLIAWVIDGKVSRIVKADSRKYYKINSSGVEVEIATLAEANKSFREIFAYPHSIILNLSVGGSMPEGNGYPGDDQVRGDLPASLQVKYARVYNNTKYYTT